MRIVYLSWCHCVAIWSKLETRRKMRFIHTRSNVRGSSSRYSRASILRLTRIAFANLSFIDHRLIPFPLRCHFVQPPAFISLDSFIGGTISFINREHFVSQSSLDIAQFLSRCAFKARHSEHKQQSVPNLRQFAACTHAHTKQRKYELS